MTRTEDQGEECLGQTGTTLQQWDMGSNHNDEEKLCAFHCRHL